MDARVLASGFSQGGPAAMALGRALQLQEGADSSFVRLIDVGDVDHSTSVMVSLPLVLEQFGA